MKRMKIEFENDLDFAAASRISENLAQQLMGESICLSWYDGLRDHECPAHVSECHDACDEPGFLDYARNRGAELRVDVNDTFTFCYRPLGEFGMDAEEFPTHRRADDTLQPGVLR